MDGTHLSTGALRMAVVFRADLPEMTRAKGEVQFGHAIAGALLQATPDEVSGYMADNQPKINMEVADLAALMAVKAKAERRGVPHFLVKDAAHTVFAEPTVTCIGIGPLTKTDLNNITREAKMRA